ncbi:predicted protein [Plenodomus lingam JN3]|uniref:Predicted protein n=1 Tax=Leptosphaeria maculans (strain JN3 / isolate v23.1.3 / race Av1-4-5-6-7-8) TaxID=985895 RepID=E5ABF3_LEPMJ|nr:predicted protein [Plenodomus lingam JN3]CBY00994.1 predicted protein [Plenodomus lingam JN3]
MSTLTHLKRALHSIAPPSHPLTNTQYTTGHDLLTQSHGRQNHTAFIIPQLTSLLERHWGSREQVRVLEIGPGPDSVLARVGGRVRRKIAGYTAFEPNTEFAEMLEGRLGCSLCDVSTTTEIAPALAFPNLVGALDVRWVPFGVDGEVQDGASKYDLVLFCHSMYGMKPRRAYIERALGMLDVQGLVVVFHRDGTLEFDGLVCHETATFPNGRVCVEDNDEAVDSFAAFVAGGTTDDKASWRRVCRKLCRRENSHLEFSAPEVMIAFNRHATALMDLPVDVAAGKDRTIKNRQARLHHPAAIVKPKTVREVQNALRRMSSRWT